MFHSPGADWFPLTTPFLRVNDDIIVAIIQNSDALALFNWRRTSKAYYTVVATVLRARYEACVQPFVINLDRFDRVLRTCGAVVSGSAALRFFLPDEPWLPHDLDVYVPDRLFDTFVTVVANDPAIGLTPVPAPPQPERVSGTPGIRGIRTICRFRTRSNQNVDVIRSSMNSPITPINAFWSTLVMNFIAPDGCACGFPPGTLHRQGIIRGALNTVNDYAAVDKYEARGFDLTGGEWSLSLADPSTWDIDYFGDVDALVISLRLRLEDELFPLPVVHSKRGWRVKHPFPLMTVREPRTTRSDGSSTNYLFCIEQMARTPYCCHYYLLV